MLRQGVANLVGPARRPYQTCFSRAISKEAQELGFGSFIGNPNKVKRGKKARLAALTQEERRKVRNKAKRRAFMDVELKPFLKMTVGVHPNGATAFYAMSHPANFPRYVMDSDTSNHKAWASPEVLKRLEEEAELAESSSENQSLGAKLFSKLKKR